MRLIYPKGVILKSSNVTETLYSEYDYTGATNYVLNDYVYVSYESNGTTERTPHKIYKCLAATTAYPPDNLTKWQDEGGSNKWAMFDEFLNTQTENATSIIVGIDASNCDRFFLFNMDADSVTAVLTDNGTAAVVQTDVYDVSDQQSLIREIYIYADATLTLTIAKTGTAKCGLCQAGWSTYLGKTQWGANPGMTDYSIKSAGTYGTYVSEGQWSKDLDFELYFDRVNIDDVYEDLTGARGILVAIEGNGDDTNYETLRLFGFINDWEITDFSPSLAKIDINFQGVI